MASLASTAPTSSTAPTTSPAPASSPAPPTTEAGLFSWVNPRSLPGPPWTSPSFSLKALHAPEGPSNPNASWKPNLPPEFLEATSTPNREAALWLSDTLVPPSSRKKLNLNALDGYAHDYLHSEFEMHCERTRLVRACIDLRDSLVLAKRALDVEKERSALLVQTYLDMEGGFQALRVSLRSSREEAARLSKDKAEGETLLLRAKEEAKARDEAHASELERMTAEVHRLKEALSLSHAEALHSKEKAEASALEVLTLAKELEASTTEMLLLREEVETVNADALLLKEKVERLEGVSLKTQSDHEEEVKKLQDALDHLKGLLELRPQPEEVITSYLMSPTFEQLKRVTFRDLMFQAFSDLEADSIAAGVSLQALPIMGLFYAEKERRTKKAAKTAAGASGPVVGSPPPPDPLL